MGPRTINYTKVVTDIKNKHMLNVVTGFMFLFLEDFGCLLVS